MSPATLTVITPILGDRGVAIAPAGSKWGGFVDENAPAAVPKQFGPVMAIGGVRNGNTIHGCTLTSQGGNVPGQGNITLNEIAA